MRTKQKILQGSKQSILDDHEAKKLSSARL